MTYKIEITSEGALPEEGKPSFDLFTVWKEYEEIAMHFNDLLLKIRTQSLAAVAAFATIAGVLLKGESISHELRWGTLTAVFIALCVFWLAIWILDFTYYNRLLLGAVKALIAIEEESKLSTRTASIYVSTNIQSAVAAMTSTDREGFNLSKGRWIFYSSVFALLVGLMIASARELRTAEQSQPSGAANAASSTPRGTSNAASSIPHEATSAASSTRPEGKKAASSTRRR